MQTSDGRICPSSICQSCLKFGEPGFWGLVQWILWNVKLVVNFWLLLELKGKLLLKKRAKIDEETTYSHRKSMHDIKMEPVESNTDHSWAVSLSQETCCKLTFKQFIPFLLALSLELHILLTVYLSFPFKVNAECFIYSVAIPRSKNIVMPSYLEIIEQ